MGALQPGVPSPSMIPQNWKIKIVDLKDCFYTIPLQEFDALCFAFTVPSINNKKPVSQYYWKVLPQGMLKILHYVNCMSPNYLNLLENNSLMLILSTMWMIFF